MNAGLSLALSKVDESIVILHQERERLARALAGEAAAAASASPFVVPFSVGVSKRVAPFEPFSPGLWFGFSNENPPMIDLTQVPIEDSLLAPPDHQFLLQVDIRDCDKAPWLTLEKLLPEFHAAQLGRLTLCFKAMSTVATPIRFELSIPRIDQQDHRVQIGSAVIQSRFDAVVISHPVDLDGIEGIDPNGRPKVIAFLPTHADRTTTIAYYTTLASPR